MLPDTNYKILEKKNLDIYEEYLKNRPNFKNSVKQLGKSTIQEIF